MPNDDKTLREVLADLLISFGGQGRALTIPRTYIELCDGDIVKALLFSQVVHLSGNGKWFYKSYSEWVEDVGLSEKQIRRATAALELEGVIETYLGKEAGSPKVHYRVVREKLPEWILTKGKSRLCPKGGVDSAQREESISVSLEVVREKETESSVGSFSEDLASEFSVKWLAHRFRSAGRKLGTSEKRSMGEWLAGCGHAESEVERASEKFFTDTFWAGKNFPPDAFRKQFQKYLDDAGPLHPVPARAIAEPIHALAAATSTVVAVVPDPMRDEIFKEYAGKVLACGKRLDKPAITEGFAIFASLTQSQKRLTVEDYHYLAETASDPKYVPGMLNHLRSEPWTALRPQFPLKKKAETKQDRAMVIALARQAARERGELVL